MVRFATLVVTGRVEGLSTGRDAQTGAIYTFVSLRVDQVLKGWAFDSRIEIKQAAASSMAWTWPSSIRPRSATAEGLSNEVTLVVP